jgi:hypothetical protein
VLVNSDVTNKGFDNSLGDYQFTKDAQPFTAVASTDFTAPRVTRTTPKAGASGVAVNAAFKVTFSERMSGITSRTLQLIGPGGKAVSASVSFKAGARSATLRPRRALKRGSRYTLRIASSVTDLALNPLRRSSTRAFRTIR